MILVIKECFAVTCKLVTSSEAKTLITLALVQEKGGVDLQAIPKRTPDGRRHSDSEASGEKR